MKTVTPDGILTLDAPELRRRSAIIVNRLRECIEVCNRVLLEKFQDTQCDAAGKLSQSIYVVESLLGKCHQEGDLLFERWYRGRVGLGLRFKVRARVGFG